MQCLAVMSVEQWMILGCVKLLPEFGVVSQVKKVWEPGEQKHKIYAQLLNVLINLDISLQS